jgi:hypothetical protein
MKAAANGHVEAMKVLLAAGAFINASNEYKNTALHWAVFTGQQEAIKCLLAAGCDSMQKNEHGLTAAMDAERGAKEECFMLILNSVESEDAKAATLGHGEEAEQQEAAEKKEAAVDTNFAAMDLDESNAPTPVASSSARESWLVKHDRPEGHPHYTPEIGMRVRESSARGTGDWRYSMMPAAIPLEKMLQFSRDFFNTTEILNKDGNTFGPEFEQQYVGHKNYFYYMNRNQVVPGAEKAAYIFEELDAYTRQVCELVAYRVNLCLFCVIVCLCLCVCVYSRVCMCRCRCTSNAPYNLRFSVQG